MLEILAGQLNLSLSQPGAGGPSPPAQGIGREIKAHSANAKRRSR